MVCTGCGLGRTEPQVSPHEIGRYYPNRYYGNAEQLVATQIAGRWAGTSSWRPEREKVDFVNRFRRSGRILDVGCAEGKFLWALDRTSWETWGLEFNAELASLGGRIKDVHIVAGTLDSAALPKGAFDAVTFWHVLEHLPDPAQALVRARELLRDNGLLIISLPRLDSWQAAWFRTHWYPFTDVPRHYYHYSKHAIELLLARAGFDRISHHAFAGSVSFHCWKHSLRSVLRSRFGREWPYYPLKPFLHPLAWLERLSDSYSTLTTVALKTSAN